LKVETDQTLCVCWLFSIASLGIDVLVLWQLYPSFSL
jgi:hypothetical protein